MSSGSVQRTNSEGKTVSNGSSCRQSLGGADNILKASPNGLLTRRTSSFQFRSPLSSGSSTVLKHAKGTSKSFDGGSTTPQRIEQQHCRGGAGRWIERHCGSTAVRRWSPTRRSIDRAEAGRRQLAAGAKPPSIDLWELFDGFMQQILQAGSTASQAAAAGLGPGGGAAARQKVVAAASARRFKRTATAGLGPGGSGGVRLSSGDRRRDRPSNGSGGSRELRRQ
ncbi:Microtubule-associated protein 70-3 [Platanthera zijinensis]|uniref:Microtubule-associated protein 70-3 n=1 Tax=Platanthera zijinensis TaxID=2320716 RepID=A0AAP0C532_9ASPA